MSAGPSTSSGTAFHVMITTAFYDPAAREGKQHDYKAIVVGTLLNSVYYVRYAFIQRCSTRDVLEQLYTVDARFPGVFQGFEANGFQSLYSLLLEYKAQEKGFPIRIETRTSTGNKYVRIEGLEGFVNNGQILFQKSGSGYDSDIGLLIDQLEDFPNGAHDDQVDAAAGAWVALPITYPWVRIGNMSSTYIPRIAFSDPNWGLEKSNLKDEASGPVVFKGSGGDVTVEGDVVLPQTGLPTEPHAPTHATGGSDPVTPADIGASPAGHIHDDRYYTETESDALFLGIADKAADSERLDGIDSERFIYGDNEQGTTYVYDADSITKSGPHYIPNADNGGSGWPYNSWWYIVHIQRLAGTAAARQIAYLEFGFDQYQRRRKSSGVWTAWEQTPTNPTNWTPITNWGTGWGNYATYTTSYRIDRGMLQISGAVTRTSGTGRVIATINGIDLPHYSILPASSSRYYVNLAIVQYSDYIELQIDSDTHANYEWYLHINHSIRLE